MIVEGLVTTVSATGELNLAPMGPIVSGDFTELLFRPYQTSATFRNLQASRSGVFHVTDNVLLLAQAALNRLPEIPESRAAETVSGRVLVDCCRAFEFEIVSIDASQPRSEMQARVTKAINGRPFLGFNRAKHACLEAAILATRVGILPIEEIHEQYRALQILVDKTAGPQEREAFALLCEYVQKCAATDAATADALPRPVSASG